MGLTDKMLETVILTGFYGFLRGGKFSFSPVSTLAAMGRWASAAYERYLRPDFRAILLITYSIKTFWIQNFYLLCFLDFNGPVRNRASASVLAGHVVKI